MNQRTRKLIIIGGIVLLVIVIAIVLVNFAKGKEEGPQTTPSPTPIENVDETISEKIVIKQYSLTNPSKNSDVRVSVPRFENLNDKKFQEYINRKMLQTVTDYQNEIEVMVDEETPAETLYKYVVSYDRFNNDKYISLVVSNNYQTGGMRSNSWKDTYNVDATKGANKEIFLKDLFSAETNYKDAIIKEINKQAEEKNYELVGGNGLSNLPDEQKFFIKDEKLIIYFNPAAIAPYVYGELNFEMPFTYENGRFVV